MFPDLGLDFIPQFTAGNVAVTIMLIGAAVIWWIRGMPDRARVKNEAQKLIHEAEAAAKVAAAAELADRFKAWRQEVHGLRNELQTVAASQRECEKALTAANILNEQLLFLIELMINELEALDPKSKTVKRARAMFARISHTITDDKSDALHTAEGAVLDAKQTLASTKETCEEVKRSEDEK